MRYVLFGDERYIKEVIYVCEDLLDQYETVLYAEAEKLEQTEFDSDCKVLLCAYDKDTAVRELQARRIEEENYVFAEELFQRMDKKYLKVPEHRKIAIWGLGKTLKDLGDLVSNWADIYVDKNPALVGSLFLGKPVYAPEEALKDFREYFFLVTVGEGFRDEIRVLLESNGYVENVDFSFWTMPADNYLPSTMLQKVLHAKPMKKMDCMLGMHQIDFQPNGDLNPCCYAWFPVIIGNILGETSVSKEWDSYKARIAKLSLVNKTYALCTTVCPRIIRAYPPEYYPLEYADLDYSNKGDNYIRSPKFAFDRACNLKCESCRKEDITTKCEEKNVSEIVAKIKEEVMPYAEDTFFAADGEVLYSKRYRELWINNSGVKRKKILVKTNGLLFNEKNWELLEQGYEQIDLHVSIDAASKETFEQVRRGGKWEILVRNMEFAAKLRKEKKLREFCIFFVVQQKNYLECKEFIHLGKQWGVDAVVFARVYNWGTYTEEEFENRISLWDADDETLLRPEFREYFSDEIFQLKKPIVGGMQHFRIDDK